MERNIIEEDNATAIRGWSHLSAERTQFTHGGITRPCGGHTECGSLNDQEGSEGQNWIECDGRVASFCPLNLSLGGVNNRRHPRPINSTL